ncbi:heavy metal translocating P-type ATPase [Anaerorhabdus sp.]|uniref:heavy metal translocating P-type ATPase n=1 Tax=Anaerorhabdus sp. TaxID=1872524 RepID=UPI002FC91D69
MKQTFNITGMTCTACSSAIEKKLNHLDGVTSCQVNLLANTMVVEYNDITENDIIQAVEDVGYGASIPSESAPAPSYDQISEKMKKRFIYSAIFTVPLFYIAMGHMMNWPLPSILMDNALLNALLQLLLTIPVLILNREFFIHGFKSLVKGNPNMDSLIAIGSTAAVLYGIYAITKIAIGVQTHDMALVHEFIMDLYFETSAMILTLITLGKYLETKSKGKTSEAISKLIDLAPKTATLIKNHKEVVVPVEDVQLGDIICVKPGQRVPVDGVITKGYTTIDESAITGESIPVEKSVHSKVVGATINKSGYFEFEATKVGQDTTLSQIIKLVEEAANSKAPISKMADKVSSIFVPTVIGIAIVSTIIWLLLGKSLEFSLSIGIAVLVISCPCALGLATPTAIMVGTGKGAENGILIKSAEILETAGSIQAIVLDKTGTITEGKPKVTDVIVNENIKESEFYYIAYSLEKKSEHPLAQAVIQYLKDTEFKEIDFDNFKSISARGINAVLNDTQYFAGNLALLEENGIDTTKIRPAVEKFAKQGKTALCFANQSEILGIIAVADVIKEDSIKAINKLHEMGIETLMLTGDNQIIAEAVFKQLNLNNYVAEVFPEDKQNYIKKLQAEGKVVAMVGDGINDAPALVSADIGIAIGAGTDVAIESADIVLTRSNLWDVITTIQLSKATLKNIKQNLFWALIYNSIGIPLAAGLFYGILGWKLNPMFGAFAMSFSSVSVVANALRLKNFKGEKPTMNIQNTKVIQIEGMSCGHCQARVEKALNAIDGVEATVNLESKSATVKLTKEVANEILKKAVEDAGYDVITID